MLICCVNRRGSMGIDVLSGTGSVLKISLGTPPGRWRTREEGRRGASVALPERISDMDDL